MFGGIDLPVRVVKIIERAYDDSGLRARFAETGRASMVINIEGYTVKVEVIEDGRVE
ncbi:hypothetical protein [Methanocalculus sp. MSAO_Arc2]|uniref:hypothetical protein n=1 Tax=Methanocalculus sp. MSAO_Arc2 TaxID=2293855 RepID=UPI00268AC871